MTKLFVLDTNVLLHDPAAVFKFGANHVFISWVVLEELDKLKQGVQDTNRQARAAVRVLAGLLDSRRAAGLFAEGLPLADASAGKASGMLFFQSASPSDQGKPLGFSSANDNLLLQTLRGFFAGDHLPTDVAPGNAVLVTLDLNLRIKAAALGIPAETYVHHHDVADADFVRPGLVSLSQAQLDAAIESEVSEDGDVIWTARRSSLPEVHRNEALWTGSKLYRVVQASDEWLTLAQSTDYQRKHMGSFSLKARNIEQSHALNLLMDPTIDFVALLGPAGTGKTLLALAAGLEQCLTHNYDSIVVTRATVPMGDDIGYLPGSEEEKMAPWMGAITDNLEVLLESEVRRSSALRMHDRDTMKKGLDEFLKLIQLRSLNYMRGRTFNRKFFIIDEAQNLTPKQIKALATRAGEGTKVVVMGNLSQIDTPYLSENSSGLTYAVTKLAMAPGVGSVVLKAGERSRLASLANDAL